MIKKKIFFGIEKKPKIKNLILFFQVRKHDQNSHFNYNKHGIDQAQRRR
jgi:hypothetical protein